VQGGVCTVQTGSLLLVKSEAQRAVVKNAAGVAVSSSQYTALPVGRYTVVFTQDGFVSSEPVEAVIKAGQPTTISAPDLKPAPVEVKSGVLTVIKPVAVQVTVQNVAGVVIDPSTYGALTPGAYTAVFSQDGFVSSAPVAFTVTAGVITSLNAPALVAVALPVVSAGYINAAGVVVAIDAPQASNFHFVAWARDEMGGLDSSLVGRGDVAAPTETERVLTARSSDQPLLGAYLVYTPDNGKSYFPVVGADVQWTLPGNAATFSGADDARFTAMSAITTTNRAGQQSTPYPGNPAAPLLNVTGILNPDTSGYSWVSLVRTPGLAGVSVPVNAAASFKGVVIGQQVLGVTFSGTAHLKITTTADQVVGVNTPVPLVVTITNDGGQDARSIQFSEVLKSGVAGGLILKPHAPLVSSRQDGLTSTFNLAAGESVDLMFDAQASAPSVYCMVGSVESFTNGTTELIRPGVTPGQAALSAQSCLTVQGAALKVTRTLSSGAAPVNGQVVRTGAALQAQITVTNTGLSVARGVSITDALTSGGADGYSEGPVSALPGTVTMNGDDGFRVAPQDIPAGGSVTYTFPVKTTQDGRYCAVTSVISSDSGSAAADSCVTTGTPRLVISNAPGTAQKLAPGAAFNSLITLSNVGSLSADAVSLQDTLGVVGGKSLTFTSGFYRITGTDMSGSVTLKDGVLRTFPEMLNIPAGSQLLLGINGMVPQDAVSGQYCDTAAFSLPAAAGAGASATPSSGSAVGCVEVQAPAPAPAQP